MRCKKCGSTNINVDSQQKTGFSWKKGFLGSLVFGAIGAVAGVGGKTKTTTEYHCMACGNIGDFSWVIMDPDTQSGIDMALEYNDTAKLKSYKQRYRNIEWTPPIQPTSAYSASITAASQSSKPTGNNVIKPKLPPDKFEIHDGILTKYNGTEAEVTIPQDVTSIGKNAFSGCKIESITIPNSVTSIGEDAFFSCKIKSITIPQSVTSIGNSIFRGCDNLEAISVEEENLYYRGEGNCLIRIEDNTLISGCKNSKIPDYIASIGKAAFWNCKNLTSITIPNGVTSIGEMAFCGCENLTSVNLIYGQ